MNVHWITWLEDSLSQWPGLWIAGMALHVLTVLLIASHALRRRREPASTILWIFVAWSFPVVGALFYLSFGIDRVQVKGFKKQITDERLLEERRAREDNRLSLAYWRTIHESVAAQPSPDQAAEFNKGVDSASPDHTLLGGNEIFPMVTGNETFPAMLQAIREAQHHVHVQSFIIGSDSVGKEFLDLLRRKAESGVIVRIMFDRFGSTFAFLGGFFRKYRDVPNMHIVGWTQANPLKRQFQINLRNHRKLLIVDGKRAFCGGINIRGDNITQDGRLPILDYHFEVRGPVVQDLQYTFMRDWYFMTDENPQDLLREVYFPQVPSAGPAMIRVINSGPTQSEMEVIADVFFMAITSARRQILAVTPYFVPTRDIVRAFRSAALRDVDVRLVLPAKNNHVYAGLAGRALYDELLSAGVRIFERRLPFMHSKALLVDDMYALVGTANLDVRSLRLNYETNLVVFDSGFIGRLKQIVLNDISMSDELSLDKWRRRPAYQAVLENLAYLMMPVL